MYVRTNTVRNTKNTTLSEQSKDGSPPPPPIVPKKAAFVNEGEEGIDVEMNNPLQNKTSKKEPLKHKKTLYSVCRYAMLTAQ